MKLCLWLMAVILVVGCGGMEGPPGPAGPQGDPGAQGPRGAPGMNGSGLASTMLCEGVRTLVGNHSVVPRHTIYRFADGSVMTTCSIDDAAAEYTGIAMYTSAQVGSQQAGCFITYDTGNTRSGGFWQFTLNGSASMAEYTDSGDIASGTRLSLACTNY